MLYGDKARKKIYEGIKQVADAVKVTMGPKGKNVIIDTDHKPIVTNDGVTVAQHVSSTNKYKNIGIKLVKEAANNTNDIAGDGTTTATMLTYAIVKEGLKYINNGVNPFEFTRDLTSFSKELIKFLKDSSTPITTKDQITQIASLSAQDTIIGNTIADMFEEVGQDGIVTVEEGGTQTSTEVVKGMQFASPFISPHFINNEGSSSALLSDVYAMVTDEKINKISQILPTLELLARKDIRKLVIIADDITGEALGTLVLNKMKGNLDILGIKAPSFGDNRVELLKDIAAMTGGDVLDQEGLDKPTLASLGKIDKIVSTKHDTTIIASSEATLNSRIDQLKEQAEKDPTIKQRLARLSGGVGIIRVGAATEMEMINKKYKVEDALNATRAAIAEGVIPGGGSIWLKLIKVTNNIAEEILMKAIEYPLRQIANNAGYKGDHVVEKVKNQPDMSQGFNAKTGLYEDLVLGGVIDPVKVERVALENAVSAAAMVLTTECIL